MAPKKVVGRKSGKSQTFVMLWMLCQQKDAQQRKWCVRWPITSRQTMIYIKCCPLGCLAYPPQGVSNLNLMRSHGQIVQRTVGHWEPPPPFLIADHRATKWCQCKYTIGSQRLYSTKERQCPNCQCDKLNIWVLLGLRAAGSISAELLLFNWDRVTGSIPAAESVNRLGVPLSGNSYTPQCKLLC